MGKCCKYMKAKMAYPIYGKWCLALLGTISVLLITGMLELQRCSSPVFVMQSVLPGNMSLKKGIPQVSNNNKRVDHIRFLKVHKAASTTMQNLFFRFAIRHNLTIVLPKTGNYITNGKSIAKPRNTTSLCDIFAIHTEYSKAWFANMPIPADGFNIAIVREPKARLVSAAYKYRNGGIAYLRKIPGPNYISTLLQQSDKYDPGRFSFTKNSMGRDFGFSIDRNKINNHLRLLDREFTLVLIVERFEESLVMLKRLLNWDLQDILYQVAHSFKHEQVNLTQADLLQLKRLNYLDYAVYEHFAEKFDDRVRNETNDFTDEVQHFKDTVEAVSKFCGDGINTIRKFEATRWNEEFVFRKSECDLMSMKELPFIGYLKRRQLR